MANLAFKNFYSPDEYINLAEELGITFVNNQNYQIQVQTPAWICETTTKPTEGGFIRTNTEPFGFTYKNVPIWIKSIGIAPTAVNVAEG